MEDLLKLIKVAMVKSGRDDFGKYLSELLSISPPAASAKLHGQTPFTDKELAILNTNLDFDPNELSAALKRGET